MQPGHERNQAQKFTSALIKGNLNFSWITVLLESLLILLFKVRLAQKKLVSPVYQ